MKAREEGERTKRMLEGGDDYSDASRTKSSGSKKKQSQRCL